MKGEGRGLIINANTPYSPSYVTILKKFNEAKSKPSEVFKSTQSFSDAELAPPSPTSMQYLIVGYVPRSAEDKHMVNNKAYHTDQQRAIGTIRPSNIIPWDEQAPPVVVVTPLAPRVDDEHLKLYALIRPRHGICYPFPVNKKRVFIRWEFRSVVSNTRERLKEWSNTIADAVATHSGRMKMVASETDRTDEEKYDGEGKEPVSKSRETSHSIPMRPTTSLNAAALQLTNSGKLYGNVNDRASLSMGTAVPVPDERETGQAPGHTVEEPAASSTRSFAQNLQDLARQAERFERQEHELTVREASVTARERKAEVDLETFKKQRSELEAKTEAMKKAKEQLGADQKILNEGQKILLEERQALEAEKREMQSTLGRERAYLTRSIMASSDKERWTKISNEKPRGYGLVARS